MAPHASHVRIDPGTKEKHGRSPLAGMTWRYAAAVHRYTMTWQVDSLTINNDGVTNADVPMHEPGRCLTASRRTMTVGAPPSVSPPCTILACGVDGPVGCSARRCCRTPTIALLPGRLTARRRVPAGRARARTPPPAPPWSRQTDRARIAPAPGAQVVRRPVAPLAHGARLPHMRRGNAPGTRCSPRAGSGRQRARLVPHHHPCAGLRTSAMLLPTRPVRCANQDHG
jgi:hypothetical protein